MCEEIDKAMPKRGHESGMGEIQSVLKDQGERNRAKRKNNYAQQPPQGKEKKDKTECQQFPCFMEFSFGCFFEIPINITYHTSMLITKG